MTKSRYYIANFPLCSMKSPLATLSGHILGTVDHIFEILKIYTEESDEQSPQQILHNMMQNNEAIFSPGILNLMPSVSTYSQEKSSQELSSPLKGKSSSSCLTQKNFQMEDRAKDTSVLESIENKNIVSDSKESVRCCEKDEIVSSSIEHGKMDIATTKDIEMKMNPNEETEIKQSKEDINVMISRNLAQIRSISIIRQLEVIGVEIDIDLSCMPDTRSPEEPEQYSIPSKKTNSPGRSGRKSKSPSNSPSKRKKSAESLCISSDSLMAVDYSDPCILEFLAKRLLSNLSCRKTCMEQIHSCFQKFLSDVRDFNNTIDNVRFVVKNLPMVKETYMTDALLKLRNDLRNKCYKMSDKSRVLLEGIERDVSNSEKCLKGIDVIEKEQDSFLSIKDKSLLHVDDLKKFELRLKEVCQEVDDIVFLKDGRRMILLNSLSDFEWLVKHFVKFLIITGILKPPAND